MSCNATEQRCDRVVYICLLYTSNAKENMRILHPLPRVNEIDVDVDENPKAYYFEQARNGVFARQAIISKALGLK